MFTIIAASSTNKAGRANRCVNQTPPAALWCLLVSSRVSVLVPSGVPVSHRQEPTANVTQNEKLPKDKGGKRTNDVMWQHISQMYPFSKSDLSRDEVVLETRSL